MSTDALAGITPSSRPTPHRPALGLLIAGSLAATTPLIIAAQADSKAALVVLGAALGLAALLGVWAIAKGRLADVLLLAAVAFMAFPIDKYFGYREHVGGWPGLRLSAADLALIALAPLLLVGRIAGRNRNAVPASVLWCYGALLVQYGISLFAASRPDLGGLELASAIHAVCIALLVAAAFRPELVRPVIALIGVQVVLHTGFAVAQAITGRPIGAAWFKGATIVRETLDTGAVRIRPSGLFDHPIVFADMLMLAVPMLAAGFFAGRGFLWRLGLVVALACAGVGLALSLSRGAWISTAVATLVFAVAAIRYGLLARGQAVRIAGALAVVALIVMPFVAPLVAERLTESNEGNLRVRFELNSIAMNMIERHPLSGVGLSNFIPVMKDYDPKDVERYFPATAHNIYLLEAAEAGVPGLLAFLAVFGAILFEGFRRLRSIEDRGQRWLAIAVLAGLIGFLVSELADFSHRLEPLRSIIWMNIGLLFALERQFRTRWRTVNRSATR